MDNLSPDTQREMLRTMQTIRRFEERAEKRAAWKRGKRAVAQLLNVKT